jgi:hypothetical protein
VLLQVYPQKKEASEVDPATEVTTQSALHVQSTFLGMSRLTTAGHPHSALHLRRARTTTSAPQWHVLKQPRVKQLQENHDYLERSAIQQTGTRQCPQRCQPKRRR